MQAKTVSLLGRVRIGCSGWQYRHWREIFYPKGLPAGSWFAFYAEHFDTVEINSSFYHLPNSETFDKWRKQAPEGFCYALKANRFITQAKKLLDCEEPLRRMMNAVRHLQDRLGPILYQLPPSFALNLERLEAFIAILPKDVTSVFEFRNKSWYVPETYELLDRYGASLCIHDMPGSATERITVGPVSYVRLHGSEGRYCGRYSEEGLLSWADWIANQARRSASCWCYFNNDMFGHALDDAQTLRSMVRQMLR